MKSVNGNNNFTYAGSWAVGGPHPLVGLDAKVIGTFAAVQRDCVLWQSDRNRRTSRGYWRRLRI